MPACILKSVSSNHREHARPIDRNATSLDTGENTEQVMTRHAFSIALVTLRICPLCPCRARPSQKDSRATLNRQISWSVR